MKKLTFLLAALLIGFAASAQFKINPQVGLGFSSISNPPQGIDFKAKAGFMAGADFRIGKKIQFQPGAFYISSVTAAETTDGNIETEDVKHNYIKFKALASFTLVDADIFRLRLNAGPAYDLLLKAKAGDTDVKQDWKDGTFFVQGGLGVDILFLTAELGYAYGLTKTFVEEYAKDSKTSGFYFTVGVVF
ncbi:MAG: PorT family protein [Bacteroidales bacterium]|nr:PorT family protein [Bacteroidales bacterium]